MTVAALERGDVLIFHGTNGVSVGQGLVSAFRTIVAGNTNGICTSNAIHAAICITGGATPRVAHCTMAGLVKHKLTELRTAYPKYSLYRIKGAANLVRDAANVARDWAMSSGGKPTNTKFATRKAALSVLGSHAFGNGAKKRAKYYASCVKYENGEAVSDFFGGPLSTGRNAGDGDFKSFYCAMFVVACYQAVMSELQCVGAMRLDAKYSSPMMFEEYL